MMKRFPYLIVAMVLMLFCTSAMAQNQRMITDTIYSKVLNAPRAYTVYLPQNFYYDQDRQYPILYLLHGMYGKNDDWANVGNLALAADQVRRTGESVDMVIVSVDAGGGNPNEFRNGYFDVPNWEYEKFFFEEFMPQIEERYRVIGDKKHRAIAGLSMGGGGATVYAQKHPDKFVASYSMSGLLGYTGRYGETFSDNLYMSDLQHSVLDNDCILFVRNADDQTKDQLRSVQWCLDCGDDDFLLDNTLDMYKEMRLAKIPCQLRVREGLHNWEFWHTALYNCLPFVSRAFVFED